jgi:putative MATE family efflux protein
MTKQNGAPTQLGTEPIGKLLMQFAIPAIIAMTASSLYNMVDSIFIGRGVGPLAISGLAITFPLMNLSAAFGAMVGVGASTLISVKLGQRDYKTAQNILGNVVTLNLIIGIVFGAFSLLFLDPILKFFGASEATLPYARDYMEIILIGNVITHSYLGLNAVLRSAGHPKMAMTATIATVILNTILDPIFIYPMGLGIRGAAYATILAQILALAWQVYLFSRPKEFLHFKRGIYGLKRDIVENTIAIGLAPFFMNACSCLVVVFINKGLGMFGGDLAIGAYGIVNRITFIFIMIVIGLNQGMQPIVGYNFGAKKFDRVSQTVKYTCLTATVITTLGFINGMFFPELSIEAFTTDDDLIRLSADGMRAVVLLYPIVGFQMVTTNFFQSIGMAKISIFLSLTRQLLFLLPGLIILPEFFGVTGVWASLPVSDALSSIITAICLVVYMRKIKRQHESNL